MLILATDFEASAIALQEVRKFGDLTAATSNDTEMRHPGV